jgi:hypothetical protein
MSTAFRTILVLAIVGLGAVLATLSSGRLYSFAPATSQSTTREATASAKAATAAGAFLATLDVKLRSKAQLELRTNLRARWSNLPTGVAMQADRGRSGGPFERNGVSLGELTRVQQDAALAVVAAALSRAGYQKVLDIVAADQVLEESVGPTRPPQNRVRFGRAEYHLAILGTPSTSQPWMIQFGGHHLAVNLTMVGASSVLTPSHTGTQPTTYTREGSTVRPLGREEEKGLALMSTLTPEQQKQATLDYTVADLVVGPGEDGKVIQPEGVRATGLDRSQQDKLLDLVSEWVAILNEAEAATRMLDVRSNISSTYFAWSGPVSRAGGAYFRIQGPTVLIEYAPQRSRGEDGLPDHIHTLYRDPTNDYAARLVR